MQAKVTGISTKSYKPLNYRHKKPARGGFGGYFRSIGDEFADNDPCNMAVAVYFKHAVGPARVERLQVAAASVNHKALECDLFAVSQLCYDQAAVFCITLRVNKDNDASINCNLLHQLVTYTCKFNQVGLWKKQLFGRR